MAKATFFLKVLMILICAAWISLWVLKPTNVWNKAWKRAEDSAKSTVFGYYSIDFAVLTLPVIVLAVTGLIYLNLQQTSRPRNRQPFSATSSLSKPLVVNSIVGILSAIEIFAVCLFILFLAWTFYARISNDFNKLMPIKSLNLNTWQLKYLRVATRFGLLAEACLALLLLPILRVLAVFRILGLQFELSVKYHIWLGTAMIFFATFHGAGTLFIWGVSDHIQEEIWKWQKTGRIYLAGEIALVTGLVIFITSLHPIRRKMFEIFYYTHHLFVVFLLFVLFHVGDRHFYWVFPGIFLFGIDKLLRIVQSKPGSFVLSARLFPCKAVELTLPKDPCLMYTPTSVVFMKIPRISNLEWHSFSVTSSSSIDEYTMSLTIKCDGEWTNSLYKIIQAELKSDADRISIAIEGPYGPPSANFLRYDNLLLVAGGIGITPFLSILKEISSSENRVCKLPARIQLIYVVKSTIDTSLLNSISSLLLNNSSSSKKCHMKLKVFVTREEKSAVTITELLNDLSKVQTVNFNKANSKYPVYGVESPIWMAAIICMATIMFFVSLTCFNHIFVPSEKKNAPSMKLAVKSEKKEKTPSWIADLIVIGSYFMAIACSAIMAIVLRARRLKEEIPSVRHKQSRVPELSLTGKIGADAEEHEIHFGGRPNFSDEFSEFENETSGGDIGVLVCGPESMRESVACLCQVKSQGMKIDARKRKSYFNFHSLSFTL